MLGRLAQARPRRGRDRRRGTPRARDRRAPARGRGSPRPPAPRAPPRRADRRAPSAARPCARARPRCPARTARTCGVQPLRLVRASALLVRDAELHEGRGLDVRVPLEDLRRAREGVARLVEPTALEQLASVGELHLGRGRLHAGALGEDGEIVFPRARVPGSSDREQAEREPRDGERRRAARPLEPARDERSDHEGEPDARQVEQPLAEERADRDEEVRSREDGEAVPRRAPEPQPPVLARPGRDREGDGEPRQRCRRAWGRGPSSPAGSRRTSSRVTA